MTFIRLSIFFLLKFWRDRNRILPINLLFILLNLNFISEKQSSKGMSMTDLFDVKLFRSHHYNLFLAGHLLLNIAYAVPFTYLPIKGEEAGFSEQSSALFFTGLGTGNAIGRITFGYVSGKFPLIRNRAYIVIVTMVALSTIPVAFTNSYLFILVCSTMFGTCAGKLCPFSIFHVF